jgi:hypothetical protein
VRDQEHIEIEVIRYLASRGQQLLALEPELVAPLKLTGRRLSIEAQGFKITAQSADGSLQTYHWAFDPVARGGERAGLKRFVQGKWVDASQF